jgi:hypothetical protein
VKNWKTTVFGAVAALPSLLQALGASLPPRGALIVTAVATILLGWNAKDKNVTGGKIQQ